MIDAFMTATVTLLLSVLLHIVFKRLTVILQLVDRPDCVRKRHKGAVPLCGGIAIFTAFIAVAFASGRADAMEEHFWFGLLVILLLGAIDDRRPVFASSRLVMQLAAAMVVVGGADIGALSLGDIVFPGKDILPLLFIVGVLFVAGLVNSWNMLDGVDGLAGGAAMVALLWLMIVANLEGMATLVSVLQVLVVCLCGFLIFNMRSPWRARASIFLGDAGSTALGVTIAYSILLLATQGSNVSLPALLWVVVVPATDTLSLIARRLLAHRSPMSGDRWHLHHLLLDYGFTPTATTMLILVVSALCGAVGYLGIRTHIAGELMAFGLFVPIVIHTIFVLAATGYFSRIRRDRERFRLREIVSDALEFSISTKPYSPMKDE